MRYLSGYDVFRSYSPQWVGWTYWCSTCGAKDLQCWENAIDIGLEPILGARDVVREKKKALRAGAKPQPPVDLTKVNRIDQLKQLVAELNSRLENK